VEFDALNWNVPCGVKVDINPAVVPPMGQPVAKFAAQPHTTTGIAGTLVLEGSLIPTKDRSLEQPATLPTENHTAGAPVIAGNPNAIQVNRLNVFNDGSVTNDIGTLADAVNASGLASIYEVST